MLQRTTAACFSLLHRVCQNQKPWGFRDENDVNYNTVTDDGSMLQPAAPGSPKIETVGRFRWQVILLHGTRLSSATAAREETHQQERFGERKNNEPRSPKRPHDS